MALYLSPRGIWRCIRRKGLLILRDVAFALVLYLLTFVFILPQNMRNVRFSPYFIEPENITDILVEQNEQRVKYAQEFLKGFTATRKEMSGPSDSKKDKEYLYSIGIITQERNNNKAKKKPFYLTQVAARFLEILHGPNGGYSDRTKIFICNVDPNTSGVKEVNTLSEHLEIVNRFSPDSINKGETDAYEKEKMDYIFCLQETLKHSSKYVILIEDDVLPIRKLLDMLTYFLETKINVRWSHGYPVNTADSWLAFKLYYPERWQGYSKTVKGIIELASFGIIVGSLLTFIYVSFLHRAGNIYFMFIVFTTYGVLLAYCIGRVNLYTALGASKYLYFVEQGHGCCTPAVVFPSKKVPALVKHLGSVKCHEKYPIDLALTAYANNTSLLQFGIVPNLVGHIGLYSSLHKPVWVDKVSPWIT